MINAAITAWVSGTVSMFLTAKVMGHEWDRFVHLRLCGTSVFVFSSLPRRSLDQTVDLIGLPTDWLGSEVQDASPL